MTTFLEKNIELIETHFVDGWFKPEFASQKELSFSLNKNYDDFIGGYLRDFYKNINLSLLSGEYLDKNYAENAKSIIPDINKIVNSAKPDSGKILECEYPPNNGVQSAEIYIKFSNDDVKIWIHNQLEELLKNELNFVVNDLASLSKRINLSDNLTTINIDIPFKQPDIKDYSKDKPYNQFFYLNYELAMLDHKPAACRKNLERLLFIYSRLRDEKYHKDYRLLVLNKCCLILRKFQKSLQKEKYEFKYIQDNEVKDFLSSDFPLVENVFGNLSAFAEERPDLDERAASIEKKIKNNETVSQEDYYCYVHQDQENLTEEKINTLLKRYKKGLSSQDVGFSDNLIFLHNCTLNWMISNKLPFEKINKKFKEINSLQKEYSNKNYFAYYKYCIYLRDELEKYSSELNDASLIKKQFEDYKQYLKTAREYADLCADNYYLPFKPAKEECFSQEHQNEGLKIYISSAYVIPVNYDAVKRGLTDMEKDLFKYYGLFGSLETIEKTKKEVTDVKDSVEKNTLRQIEILGIFAGIVLFASSSVQLFKEVDNFQQALQFMFTFSYSICSMILLIWLITRENLKSISLGRWIIIALFFSITAFAVIWLIISFDSDSFRFLPVFGT